MTISICVPTYNQGTYLEQAVRSAAEQTRPPSEIIVSNDCSTDATSEVLRQLSREIPCLKVINQPINLGIAKNTDICLRTAKSEFVVRLDSDDLLMPEFCEKLSDLLEQFPEAGYAHAAVQEIDENGNYRKNRTLFRNQIFQQATDSLRLSVKGYKVAANIIMFRRKALAEVDYVTARPNYVEDFHLSAAIAVAGWGNVYSDEILSRYRVWTGAGKVRQRRKLDEIVGIRRVFEDILGPAFERYGWDEGVLIKQRSAFASGYAECLYGDTYTQGEKAELKRALLRLSSTPKARLIISLFSSRFAGMLLKYFVFRNAFRAMAKNLCSKTIHRSAAHH